MQKKFECWECGCKFVADDQDIVECPKCHSDNVEYASVKIFPWIKKIISVIIAALAVYALVIFCLNRADKEEDIVASSDTQKQSVIEATKEYVSDGNIIVPSFELVTLKYDDENMTYEAEFSVNPGVPKVDDWLLVIYDLHSDCEVARSNNGVFEKIKPSEKDGAYTLRMLDSSDNVIEGTERDIMGFDKIIKITKPLSPADVEKLLNSANSITDNPYIDHMHKVHVSNKPKGDESITETLTDVQRVLKSARLKAKVAKVEYNELKQVNKIVMTINYPAGWDSNEEDEEDIY